MLKSPFSYLNQLVRRVALYILFIFILLSSITHADPNTVALDTNLLRGTYTGLANGYLVRIQVNKGGRLSMTYSYGFTYRGVGEIDSNGKVWIRYSSNGALNTIFDIFIQQFNGLPDIVYQDGLFKINDTYTLAKVSYDKNNPVPERLLTKPGYSQSGLGYYTFGVETKQDEPYLQNLDVYPFGKARYRVGCGYLKLRPDGRIIGAIHFGEEYRSSVAVAFSGSINNANKFPFAAIRTFQMPSPAIGFYMDGTSGEIEFDDSKLESDINGLLEGALLLKGSLINLNLDLSGALGLANGGFSTGNSELEIYRDRNGLYPNNDYVTIKSSLSATVSNNSISILDSLNLWTLRYLPTTGFIKGYVVSRVSKIPKSRIIGAVNTKSGIMYGTVLPNLVTDVSKIQDFEGPIPTGSALIIRKASGN
jgi:hypothetical protein